MFNLLCIHEQQFKGQVQVQKYSIRIVYQIITECTDLIFSKTFCQMIRKWAVNIVLIPLTNIISLAYMVMCNNLYINIAKHSLS